MFEAVLSETVFGPFPADGGQITHLIRVRLKIFLYDFFRGVEVVLPFLSVLPFSFLVLQYLHLFWDIPCAISQGDVQTIRKRHMTLTLDGQNRQSPIASDFGSRTQIAALLAVLLYRNV